MGKWGPPLSPEEKGLAQTVIRHMSLHAALPAIVALDTFTGNADRSNPNIFYNKEAHAFCGIDMAGAFNSLLAVPAVFQLTRVLNGDIYLGPKEIFALGQYRLTLNFLIENYPPEKLYEMLENYARQAGLMESAKNRIAHHKRIIQQNYQDCRALLYLMNSPEFLDLLDRRE
jgi:hypothetical protein